MSHYNLALIGFGNVGKAFARLLLSKQDSLKADYEISFAVTAITTGSHGSAIDAEGIDLEKAIDLVESGGSLDELSTTVVPENMVSLLKAAQAQVLFENTPVSYDSGQPAIDTIKAALNNGIHAVTANKGPVVHAYQELTELAEANNVRFYFESTVMDGAPVFSLGRSGLPAAKVLAFKGVLNSTTNLILSQMEGGQSFDEAVAYAQSIGIAETDPSGDVDGWDAAIKVAALMTVLMGIPMNPDAVDRKGIGEISSAEIEAAQQEGKRWKLVCSAERHDGHVHASVAPEMVGPESPLFIIDGTTSIVQLETDVLGKLSLIEEDPGPHTTAYGLLADFINAVSSN
ncbi:MAG: homoserine dehydrogenase [Chloroflexi bacterium]|nr:MAG: homoserine dehydrogenase [Chloroflexota bacterium]MBL1196602.1 homoserine dehydrogenase [Chloroflexota bacterium]NOH13897.1 homoserine dehydrogenase [Chloroflexota bacterium]